MNRLVRDRPIALFGLFGVGNIGNEASLAAGISAVRQHLPEADIIVVAADPDQVAEQHGVRAVPITMAGPVQSLPDRSQPVRLLTRPLIEAARWASAFQFARSVSAFVVPGTGILDDFGVKPYQMPYALMRWSTLARITRRPWSMIGVGAGPINHRWSRRLMRRTVLNSDIVTYRDEESRAFMAKIGVSASVDAVQPDIAFALPRPSHDGSSRAGEVGLGVMAYYGWENDRTSGQAIFDAYTAAMSDIATHLLTLGRRVRLLIGERADIEAAERIIDSLRQSVGRDIGDRLVFEPVRTFDQLLLQVARTDALIATRYHNVVAGLMTATPTVSIGYAEKNCAVMELFSLGDLCHHVDNIDVDAVVQDTTRSLQRADEIRPTLRHHADRMARLVDDRFTAVLAEVSDRGAPTLSPPTEQHDRTGPAARDEAASQTREYRKPRRS